MGKNKSKTKRANIGGKKLDWGNVANQSAGEEDGATDIQQLHQDSYNDYIKQDQTGKIKFVDKGPQFSSKWFATPEQSDNQSDEEDKEEIKEEVKKNILTDKRSKWTKKNVEEQTQLEEQEWNDTKKKVTNIKASQSKLQSTNEIKNIDHHQQIQKVDFQINQEEFDEQILPDEKSKLQHLLKIVKGIQSAKTLAIDLLKEKDTSQEYFEQIFICKICYINYDSESHKPLVLTCGHTFCQTCVASFLKNQLVCPFDKKQLVNVALDSIGKNYDLQECQQLYEESQKKKESHCNQLGLCLTHKKKAKFICEKCTQNDGDDGMLFVLCSECIIQHLDPSLHKLVSLKTITNDVSTAYFTKLEQCSLSSNKIKDKISGVQVKNNAKYRKYRERLEKQAQDLINLINKTLHDKLKESERLQKISLSDMTNKTGSLFNEIKALQSKQSKDSVLKTMNVSDFEKLQDIENRLRELEKIQDSDNYSLASLESTKFQIPYSVLDKYVDIVDDQ